MDVTLKIPEGVVEHCLNQGINESDIPKIYKAYIEESLGAFSHFGILDGFVSWADTNDITEYL